MQLNHHKLEKVDPLDPYRTTNTGLYQTELTVNGVKRQYYTYIPDGVKASTYGVCLLPPSGMSAMQFLDESNWVDIADGEEHREKLVLFVLEAENGGDWKLDNIEYEREYVWQVFNDCFLHTLCGVYEGRRGYVGYREGGTVAQAFAMWNPADIAAIATVDAPALSSEYIANTANELCPRLHNFVDEKCVKGITKGEIPMRAWFIGGENPNEIRHWRNANRDEKQSRKIEMDTVEYFRTNPLDHPQDGELGGYTVWVTDAENASANCGNKWNRSIWKKFLYQYTRWAGNPGGSYRKNLDPVYDLGMDYRYELVDGWMREWYIHVPQSVRQNPDKKVPLVFVPHGYSVTGEVCVRNADWYRVADKHGFIAIFPTAIYCAIRGNAPEAGVSPDNCPLPGWNVYDDDDMPNELNFFLYMLDDMCKKYPVDRSRVFASGTSMGNLMVQYLAMKRPDLFAAIAPTSGIIHMAEGECMLDFEDVKNRPQLDVPVWMFGGEMEG